FPDSDGLVHKLPIPMELLADDGSALRKLLLSQGLLMGSGRTARQLLIDFVMQSEPPQTARLIKATGWTHDLASFVLPKATIGKMDNEPLVLDWQAGRSPYSQMGTQEDCQELARLCLGNSRLIFSLCVALAGPLLAVLKENNCAFHLRGYSSSGKTTCLRLASSVWGGRDFTQTWRSTANGLEGMCCKHNDTLLCLDELAEVDPREAFKAAYMLVNGTGKLRASRDGSARTPRKWRAVILSTGEVNLSTHLSEGCQRVHTGQELRLLDLPADTGSYGCFEDLHGSANGQDFAERVAKLVASTHGHIGPQFVSALVERLKDACAAVEQLRKGLRDRYVGMTASSQVRRAFNAFSLVAAAGELAVTFGVLPWPEGTAAKAAMRLFEDWLQERGDAGLGEESVIVRQIRHFFELHGESRFSPWEPSEYVRATPNRAGFRKEQSEGGHEYFVFRQVFRQEICKGLDQRLAAKICLDKGWLQPGPNGEATRSERLPNTGKSTRVYRFTSKVLEEEIDEDV
ncbi:MAG: DUF927 domain-containing protein, partial [Chlamydiia bacterium]|nr:DUF927 domain-containing protein [Chlamydiia bacterium]